MDTSAILTWPDATSNWPHRNLRPVNSALYHAEPKAREFEKPEIDKMLCMNIIEPAQSECALSIVVASEMGESLRICIDYKKRIALAVTDGRPIRRVEKCMDSLHEVCIF